MSKPILFQRIAEAEEGGLLKRAFRRLRQTLRETPNLEETATRSRVVRLFAVNFRTPWTR
jgi:hypothetical protein